MEQALPLMFVRVQESTLQCVLTRDPGDKAIYISCSTCYSKSTGHIISTARKQPFVKTATGAKSKYLRYENEVLEGGFNDNSPLLGVASVEIGLIIRYILYELFSSAQYVDNTIIAHDSSLGIEPYHVRVFNSFGDCNVGSLTLSETVSTPEHDGSPIYLRSKPIY